MKRIVLLLFVSVCYISSIHAEGVQWYTWNEGASIAQEQNKPMMVFVHATWCHMCKRMDTKVFTDGEVAAKLNRFYIPVKLDVEYSGALKKDGENYTAMELLGKLTNNELMGIPALLFVPANQKKRCSLVAGLKDTGEMMALLKKYK